MLLETIQDHLKTAMKAGNAPDRDAIRLLISAIKDERIALGHELSDEEAGKVATRLVKRTRGSIEEYERLNLPDAVVKLAHELAVYQRYAPEELSEETVRAIVTEAVSHANAQGPQDMGKVMKLVMPRVQGKADGALVNRLVKEALAP